MLKLALLGRSIQHSRSKEMYQRLLGEPVDYSLLDYEKEEDIPSIEELFGDRIGLSITFPYKQTLISQVKIEDANVLKLNAINCIGKKGNQFFATNTDFLAVENLLNENYGDNYDSYIILGSGNMSRVFQLALEKLSLPFKVYSRREHGDLNTIDYREVIGKGSSQRTLIVNTCSRDFIFDQDLGQNYGFWDMNYNFPPHKKLESFTMSYYEGIDVLLEQAKFALYFWELGHLIKTI